MIHVPYLFHGFLPGSGCDYGLFLFHSSCIFYIYSEIFSSPTTMLYGYIIVSDAFPYGVLWILVKTTVLQCCPITLPRYTLDQLLYVN